MKGTGIATQLREIKNDLMYIESKYGSPDNLDQIKLEQYETLISDPSKSTAFDCIREILSAICESGYVERVGTLGHIVKKPLPMFEDDRVKAIILRWNLPFPELEL